MQSLPWTANQRPLAGCRRPSAWAQALALGLLLCCPVCDIGPADIARWKQTQKGPDKLHAALGRVDLRPELRAQAAQALLEIGRGEEVEAALGEMDEPSRRAIVHLLVPQLVAQLQKGPPDAPPTPAQLEAKDGLFRVRLLGEPDDRRAAEEALLAWVAADLSGRMSAGLYGTERIVLAIGARARGALLAVLARTPLGSPNLVPAASLLGRVGDPESKRSGAEHIVRLLRPAVAKGREGAQDRAAQRAVEDGLRALGLLGGPAAVEFLVELADKGPEARRKQAFAALRETGDPQALETALRVAGDPREPGGVREAAFHYLERAGQIAVAGLCGIIADPRDPGKQGDTARFRALEAALSAGGGPAVGQALAALPTNRAYDRDDFVALVVHQLTALGAAARPHVRAALQSPSWVARAAAVLALGEAGGAAEADALAALAGDTTRLRVTGLGAATVGELAREQAERLRQKR